MGLKVWLPLDGNLENKGCSNVTITNNGATIDANGKIGSCYNFAGSGQRIKMTNPITNGINSFSICTWFYMTAASEALFGARTSGSGAGLLCFLYADRILFDDGARFTCNYNVNNLLNSWHHIACVKTPTQKIIYIDGVSIGSQNTTAATATIKNEITIGNDSYEKYTGNDLIGKLNDFRIYDHCLSAAEVKEISKGLICHYKFENIYMPNLITTNVNLISSVTADGVTVTQESGCIKITDSNSGNRRIYYSLTNAWKPINSTYTVSFDAKANANGNIIQLSRSLYATDATKNISLTTEWKHYSDTITITAAVDGGTLSIQSKTNNNIFWIKNIKLERNPIETASTLVNICPDTSGYSNNGTITGSAIKWAEAPRYKGVAQFDKSWYITAQSPTENAKAVSFWIKCAFPTEGVVVWADYKTKLAFGFSSVGDLLIWCYENDSAKKTVYVRSAMIENAWNHVVVQKTTNDNDVELYMNGVKQASSGRTSYWTHTTDTLMIGRRSSANATFIGCLSDFRMYASRLNDEDILSLYQTNACVGDGSIQAYEYQETFPNIIINNNGIINESMISELNILKKLQYDSNIYIEPDGSAWVRIYHHNNPSAGSFASTDDFVNSVYIDDNRWFNIQVCDDIDKWEFMVKGKFTATSDEWKLRWIQTVNPMVATYEQVAAANVTKITGNGYSSYTSSWGGLYAKKGSAYLTTNNSNSGNWWGAVGSYSVYQGGIPGWGPSATVTTTGYNDLYLRIDNLTLSNIEDVSFKQSGAILAHQIIES